MTTETVKEQETAEVTATAQTETPAVPNVGLYVVRFEDGGQEVFQTAKPLTELQERLDKGKGRIHFDDGSVRVGEILFIKRYPNFMIPGLLEQFPGVLDSTAALVFMEGALDDLEFAKEARRASVGLPVSGAIAGDGDGDDEEDDGAEVPPPGEPDADGFR